MRRFDTAMEGDRIKKRCPMPTVTINRATKTLIFEPEEKEKIKGILHGRMRWETGRNRWFATGDLDEIARALQQAGYEVEFIGRKV
jgi:hypothetical protein